MVGVIILKSWIMARYRGRGLLCLHRLRLFIFYFVSFFLFKNMSKGRSEHWKPTSHLLAAANQVLIYEIIFVFIATAIKIIWIRSRHIFSIPAIILFKIKIKDVKRSKGVRLWSPQKTTTSFGLVKCFLLHWVDFRTVNKNLKRATSRNRRHEMQRGFQASSSKNTWTNPCLWPW